MSTFFYSFNSSGSQGARQLAFVVATPGSRTFGVLLMDMYIYTRLSERILQLNVNKLLIRYYGFWC